MGGFLGGLVSNAVGFAPYAAKALQENDDRDMAKAAQALAQRRQQTQDDMNAALGKNTLALGEANRAHLSAETNALNTPKSDVKAVHPAQDGSMWVEHNDGTFSPASMRGAQSAPTAPGSNADDRPGNIDLSAPQQGTQAASPPQQSTPQALPKFGPRPPREPDPATIPGTPANLAAEEAKLKLGLKYRPAPEPTILQGTTAPGDPPKFFRVNKQGGPAEEIQGIAGKTPTGSSAMSGQTMATMARMGMSYNDLKAAVARMEQYENTPGNLAKQTAGKQALGAMAEVHPSSEAHGLTGALNNGVGAFIGAAAGQHLGQDDPGYRTYLADKQKVATAFTELLPRPNQQLLQLEKGLSGADVSWNPDLLQGIQGRRRGGLDVLQTLLAQQGMLDANGNMTGAKQGAPAGGRAGGSGAAPTARPTKQVITGDQAAFLKSKKGMSDADIAARYTVTP